MFSRDGCPPMPATIPGGDAEFNAWLDNFVTYATANMAILGLVTYVLAG